MIDLDAALKKAATNRPIKTLIGSATFANGTRFKVEHTVKNKRDAYIVTNLNDETTNIAGSEAAAWRSIRYQGRVSPKSDKSTDNRKGR